MGESKQIVPKAAINNNTSATAKYFNSFTSNLFSKSPKTPTHK